MNVKKKTRRLTLIVTPDVEESLKSMKRELYYDHTKSEMIRELVAAGVRSCQDGRLCTERRKNA